MTNLEKYFGILDAASGFIKDFRLSCKTAQLRKNGSFTDIDCSCIGCSTCREDNIKWLLSEYEQQKELENGDRLKQGQLIEVSRDGEYWYKRYFLIYVDGIFWCYYSKTSTEAVSWKHARLPEKEGGE